MIDILNKNLLLLNRFDKQAAFEMFSKAEGLLAGLEEVANRHNIKIEESFQDYMDVVAKSDKVLCIRFTHGRKDPAQDMEEFGYEGRKVIIDAFQWTYKQNLQLLNEDGGREFLEVEDDLIKMRYKGETHYFGDFFVGLEIIDSDTLTFEEFVSTQNV